MDEEMLKSVPRKTSSFGLIEIIIGTIAIMFIWRGLWNLLDAYLFKNDFVLSQLTTVFLGIVILFILLYVNKRR